MGGIALVVHVQRTPARRDRSVVHDGADVGSDTLADKSGKSGGLLAIKVCFQAMPDRLVKENARPTWPQHNLHRTCWRVAGVELKDRLSRRFPCESSWIKVAAENLQRTAAASPLAP